MNVCLEHYTNGSARDHQISVHNNQTNLDDLFVDEMEIVYRPAPEQQITVEIPDTPPPPIFDSRDPMSVTIARVSKLISSDSTSQNFINLKLRELFILNTRWYNINRLRLEAKGNGVSFSSALSSQLTQLGTMQPSCPHCGKGFSRKDNVIRYMRSTCPNMKRKNEFEQEEQSEHRMEMLA
ncbi:hypothetical protein FQA39_LY15989 [Lamprigera yunnana]|nr:hypothetical protein FQA39_LY15989 [Lamprigera yunnana]